MTMEELAINVLSQLRLNQENHPLPSKLSLRVDILSARGLELDKNYIKLLQLHVLFRGQIVRSEDFITSPDPIFNFTSNFDFQYSHSEYDATALMQLNETVLIYITYIPQHKDDQLFVGLKTSRTLIAAAIIDYKYSLLHTGDYLSVELLTCEPDGIFNAAVAGVLFLRLSLENLPTTEILANIPRSQVEHQVEATQELLTKENKEFYQLTRSWWKRLRKTYAHVDHHNIKLLAKDETGQYRFVCSFLNPILSPREIDGPRFAARFVSLIPFLRDSNTLLGSSRVDTCWKSPHAFLACMQGDVEVRYASANCLSIIFN